MGALHDGHLSLVTEAQVAAGLVVVSNPTQFGPNEDLSRGPRDEVGDLAKLRDAGCGLAWLPMVGEMHPEGGTTFVGVRGVCAAFEGAIRSGHFRGVDTV